MRLPLTLIALTALSLPQVTWGQYGMGSGLGTTVGSQSGAGGSTTSGMFGSRTLGGNNTSSRSGSGNGTGSATAPVGQGSQLTGSERFLEQNRQGAFVGADTGDTSNAMSAQAGNQRAMQGLQGLSNMFSQMNRGRNQPNNGDNRQGNRVQLRIPMRVGFTTKSLATTRVSAAFQTRLTKLPALQGIGQVQVSLEGDTVVLRGQVATEADRKLVADLASLEPGIAVVRNELAVDPAASTGAAPAPSNPAPQ